MPAQQIHLVPEMLWLILLTEAFGGKGGNAADIALNCPDRFREGQINIITCAINSTSIRNGCPHQILGVGFKLTLTSGHPVFLCSIPYPPTSCAPDCTAKACFCGYSNTDVFTFQHNFLGQKSYNGGDFTCNICPSPSKPLSLHISQNCKFLGFETTTSTTTTSAFTPEPKTLTTTISTVRPEPTSTSTASNVTTAPEATQSKMDYKVNENVVAVIVLAVVLTVVLVLIVTTVIWFWRRGWSFPCADNNNRRHTELNQPNIDTSETPVTTHGSNWREGEGRQYETLRLEDVGMRSPYAEIQQEINTQEIPHYEVF